MCEIPSVRLSDTWFGTPANGDLCYALDSTLERSSADLDIGLRAVCSLILRNSAKEDLKFERIAVHVEHLKLFSADDRFWTNEITVAFRGTEEVSNVTYGTTPPSTVSGACRVSGPRQSFDRSLIKRSFNLFREIAGI